MIATKLLRKLRGRFDLDVESIKALQTKIDATWKEHRVPGAMKCHDVLGAEIGNIKVAGLSNAVQKHTATSDSLGMPEQSSSGPFSVFGSGLMGPRWLGDPSHSAFPPPVSILRKRWKQACSIWEACLQAKRLRIGTAGLTHCPLNLA